MRTPIPLRAVAAALVAAVVFGACAKDPEVEQAGAVVTPRPATNPAGVHGTFGAVGINTLANHAQAAVVGKVTGVSAPKPTDQFVMHDSYVDVSIAVEEVLFDSPEMKVAPAAVLTVHSFVPRAEAPAPPGTPAEPSQLDGPWTVGQQVVVAVSARYADRFPFDGAGPHGQVVQGFQGRWTITPDGRAVSTHQARNADATRLKARLKGERARGKDPARDRCTVVDPFGDEKPGCPPAS